MMGLALKNVTLTLFEDGKDIFEEQGEMLFTHFGISGPLTLSASSHLGDMKKHRYHAEIDLKPALSEEQLYDRHHPGLLPCWQTTRRRAHWSSFCPPACSR